MKKILLVLAVAFTVVACSDNKTSTETPAADSTTAPAVDTTKAPVVDTTKAPVVDTTKK